MTRDREQIDQRQAVQDTCITYALALDAQDWDRLRSVFTPDAVADYGSQLGTLEGYASIEAACQAALVPLTASQHLMGNHLITLADAVADAVSYFQATHIKLGADGGDRYTVAGRYDDRLVQTDGGWRITYKTLTVMWVDGNPAVLAT